MHMNESIRFFFYFFTNFVCFFLNLLPNESMMKGEKGEEYRGRGGLIAGSDHPPIRGAPRSYYILEPEKTAIFTLLDQILFVLVTWSTTT